MAELSAFFAVLGVKETILWFLTVITGILVFDSWRGILAQETFFKTNKSADAIHKTDYVAPGKKLPSYQIDAAKCVKCGACMATCKLKAIVKK